MTPLGLKAPLLPAQGKTPPLANPPYRTSRLSSMSARSSADSPTISAETRKYLPWLVAVALFMENLDATIVNTAVPTMAANLQVAPLSLKAVLTSYTLSLAVFIPVSGWFADRFG